MADYGSFVDALHAPDTVLPLHPVRAFAFAGLDGLVARCVGAGFHVQAGKATELCRGRVRDKLARFISVGSLRPGSRRQIPGSFLCGVVRCGVVRSSPVPLYVFKTVKWTTHPVKTIKWITNPAQTIIWINQPVQIIRWTTHPVQTIKWATHPVQTR